MGALFRKWFVPHRGNGHAPHFLRLEALSAVLAIAVVAELGFFGQAFLLSRNPGLTASILPSVLVNITNQERADNQAPPLAVSPLLREAAQEKADDMAAKGYFSHTTPEGYSPWHWLQKAGYSYKNAGENLAVNFFDSADVANAWMNSPEHRANVVNPQYSEIGIAMAEGRFQGHDAVFVVEFFGTPKSAPIPAGNPSGADRNPNLNQASALAAFEQIAASPRAANAALLAILLWITLLALGILAVSYSHSRHKKLLGNGIALAAAIGALLLFNIRFLSSTGRLPSGSQPASVSESLQ